MPGKFVVKKSGQQFMWNLKAGNGKIVLTSERYKTKASALNGIKSVKANCSADKCYDRKVAKSGAPCFTMVARNGEVIGRSQMYASTSGRETGIKSIKSNARGAKIEDLA